MLQILTDLTPLNRVVCSSDTDRAIDYLRRLLPFRVLEFPATEVHNGWVIPPRWDVKDARILRAGRTVYDATEHPLAVIALSAPFRGTVDREELRTHLHYDRRFDDALTFHFRQQFRSWARDWGFTVPRRFYEALEPGGYDVVIDTDESPGVLKVVDYEHRGARDETIVLGANLDHPGVANDGLSGVAVGLELMRRLHGRETKYTYRLVLVPGIIGSEYYLGRGVPEERDRFIAGVFLEMLGSRTPLALQHSRAGDTDVEHAIIEVARERAVDFRDAPFEGALINDEYLWEAYGVPMASLSRFPYPEYHSSRDNVTIIDKARLDEAVDLLEAAIALTEATPLVTRRFRGTLCLSNPRYDLYVDPGQVAFGDQPDEQRLRLRRLMDLVPTLDRPTTARRLAAAVGLPESAALAYLQRWADKALITLE